VRETKTQEASPDAHSGSARPRIPTLLTACAAAFLPLVLILFLLKPTDLVYVPHYLAPSSQNYSTAIERASSTSESLITITLAILGASAVWYLRDRGRSVRHYLLYAVFVLALVSIYSGIKLGYSASMTLATGEPDLFPLLSLLKLQASLSLAAGLLLSGVVVFGSLDSRKP
jgi:hypothetical protein